MRFFSLLLLFVLVTGPCLAQEPIATSEIRPKPNLVTHVGLNAGIALLHNPIHYDLIPVAGYQFCLSQQVLTFLNVASTTSYSRTLLGRSLLRPQPSKTELINTTISIEYNFFPATTRKSRKRQVLFPYFSSGIGLSLYQRLENLYDQNGHPYYFWSDGTIRDLDESDPEADAAVHVSVDKNYETRAFKSPKPVFSLPIEIGLRIRILKFLGVNVAIHYQRNFSSSVYEGGESDFLKASDHFFLASGGISLFFGGLSNTTPP